MSDKTPLVVEIADDMLVIKLGIETLRMCCDHNPAFYDGESGRQMYTVTDPKAFASEVCRMLESEEEDGSTLVTKMLDAAMEDAIDDGCEGVENIEAAGGAT